MLKAVTLCCRKLMYVVPAIMFFSFLHAEDKNYIRGLVKYLPDDVSSVMVLNLDNTCLANFPMIAQSLPINDNAVIFLSSIRGYSGGAISVALDSRLYAPVILLFQEEDLSHTIILYFPDGTKQFSEKIQTRLSGFPYSEQNIGWSALVLDEQYVALISNDNAPHYLKRKKGHARVRLPEMGADQIAYIFSTSQSDEYNFPETASMELNVFYSAKNDLIIALTAKCLEQNVETYVASAKKSKSEAISIKRLLQSVSVKKKRRGVELQYKTEVTSELMLGR